MNESHPPIDELDELSFRSYAMFVQSKLMSSIFNLEELLEISIDAFVELMRVDVGFMLFNEKAQQLSVEAVKGLKSHTIRKTKINVDKDIIQWIIEKKTPIFLSELEETLPIKILFQKMVEKVGIDIVLSIPLVVKKNLVGLINLGRREFEEPFKQADLRFLYTMADQVALAIENANLHQEKIEEEKLRFIEHKRAEETLRESEEKYRLLVNNATDAIFVAQDEVIKFPNPRTEELVGYSAEELATISFTELIHPEDTDMVRDRHRRRLKGESLPTTYSFRIINRAGEELWAQLNTVVITWEGRPATLNFLRDITPQRKLEVQLRQSQKMEAIGTLAGGIAHDFNNILAAIIGYTELADLQVAEDTKLKENLWEVLNAGRRARELVKQILAFSRQSDQERMPIQMRSIVKETIKLVRASLPSTIEIRQNIESNFATIEADPTQMQQIIMNLCTNALHAMSEEGGILEINLSEIELDSYTASQYPDLSPGKYIRLTVSDTGFGMDKEVVERIFDPYFTTKEKGRGTGLGLSVIHGIVKNHGGAITVYSEPGKGSTFHVYIPAIQMGVVEEKDEVETLPTGHERILFIDDEPPLVEIGKQILEHMGYQVVSRTSSIEALELFRTKPDQFDLVITDMTMPHMTGDKLSRELMKIRPDIPIILCTGYSERITEEKAKGMGIKAFVMKPLVMRDLAKTVREVLDPALSKV